MLKIIKGQSFLAKPIADADIYVGCNFSQTGERNARGQWTPTDLKFPAPGPKVFLECNLTNAMPPPGSTVLRCNTTLAEFNVPVSATTYKNTVWGNVHPDTLAVVRKLPIDQIRAKPDA